MERAQKKTSKDDQNTCSDDQNNSEFLNEEYLKARQRRNSIKTFKFHQQILITFYFFIVRASKYT